MKSDLPFHLRFQVPKQEAGDASEYSSSFNEYVTNDYGAVQPFVTFELDRNYWSSTWPIQSCTITSFGNKRTAIWWFSPLRVLP